MDYFGMAIDNYKLNLAYIPTDVPYQWDEQAKRQPKPTPLQSKRRDEAKAIELARLYELEEERQKKTSQKRTRTDRPSQSTGRSWYERFERSSPLNQSNEAQTQEQPVPITTQQTHPEIKNGNMDNVGNSQTTVRNLLLLSKNPPKLPQKAKEKEKDVGVDDAATNGEEEDEEAGDSRAH
ncbi:hypothetical protein TGAM01_v202145 [Trichoderma gamsii]|uniref:Uncharacterized protein n=1 Tax=Trichoderma gamsii TaxID=398673 RepID=A0A2P4ZXM3_9HYPO|nr:hypothetical protein TGAM01_v202145 [Trichoderma gamsii]PON29037.1 hypothetical protein TGAM01_v202145 [Trichoderma gamsii]